MKDYKLTAEEKQILEAFENGELKPVPNMEQQIKDAVASARYTLNKNKKTKNISVEVSENDLHKIKAKATKQKLPYQNLISTILHKFATQE